MFTYDWRRLRQLKTVLPFVRRRVYRKLHARHDALVDAVHAQLPADAAPLDVRMPVPPGLHGEVCLFVTHAAQPQLKSHVRHHIEHLLRAGLQVALIVNTDLPPESMVIDAALQSRLCGLYVRANRGFDFGAWCHVLRLCDRREWQRLYLVNDSVVGPVQAADFDAMMQAIRASSADVQGLTESAVHIPHLQSYFLVFGRRVLESAVFERFVQGAVNLADKAQVIEVYELRLTRTLREAGFEACSVFQSGATRAVGRDPLNRWQQALRAGFPYVKTSVLRAGAGEPQLQFVREKAQVDTQV